LSKKHELKLGSIKLLAGGIFEGTYEYIYGNDFTFGASALVILTKAMITEKIFHLHLMQGHISRMKNVIKPAASS
jgi:hypothetical protein